MAGETLKVTLYLQESKEVSYLFTEETLNTLTKEFTTYVEQRADINRSSAFQNSGTYDVQSEQGEQRRLVIPFDQIRFIG